MSKIRVWTSDGRWSDEILGLDKVYLIKEAIRRRLFLINYEDAEEDLDGFEINHCPVSDFLDEDGDYYNEDDIVRPENKEKFLYSLNKRLPLSQAQSFIMPLDVLKGMRDDHSLSAKYDQIISLVKVPTPTPKGYCILMQFMDESHLRKDQLYEILL